MSTQIITGIDVFGESDPTRPCASIQRVGGGLYKVLLLGANGQIVTATRAPNKSGEGDLDHFDNIDDAVSYATAHADELDQVPVDPLDRVALGKLLAAKDAQISAQATQITTLEAAVAVVPVTPAKQG